MIECIFTIDYEIYGNGRGSLKDLVYEPAEKLKAVFEKHGARCVVFVEAAELEMMEVTCADPAIDLVRRQLRDFYSNGFELGLHLHPQWYKARYKNNEWLLDYDEYNLCTLPQDRISQILDRSVDYLRKLLGASDFAPISFRAGNWLLQPTRAVAKALFEHGIKIDSSVYKGGLQYQFKLDYRRSLKNGYYWSFTEDVNTPDPHGILLEIPTYTKMVPIWKMLNSKRISLRQKGASKSQQQKRPSRLKDFLRPWHPKKLDFCRLTKRELIHMFDKEIQKDQESPAVLRPIVAIGHTKDLVDLETVESFISHLHANRIPLSTFREVYHEEKGYV